MYSLKYHASTAEDILELLNIIITYLIIPKEFVKVLV